MEKGRLSLDARWTITPVGGVTKVGSFMALFAGGELHVAVLTDFHTGIKRKVRDLKESAILESGHVFSADSFSGQDEADVEDMIGRDLYVEIVNRSYDLDGNERLPSIRVAQTPIRVIEEVEEHLQLVALDAPTFDHMRPAVYLTEHENDFRAANGVDVALDRFEQLFVKLNSLLPTK